MEGPTNLSQSKIMARVVSIIENCKCYSFENMIINVLIYFDWNFYTYSSQLANVIFCFRKVKSTLAQNTYGYFKDLILQNIIMVSISLSFICSNITGHCWHLTRVAMTQSWWLTRPPSLDFAEWKLAAASTVEACPWFGRYTVFLLLHKQKTWLIM